MDDDHLGIKMNDSYHLVDTIIQFKRTKAKRAMFRLQMCCQCCLNKNIWVNMKIIEQNGTETLKQLAKQVQDLYQDGIDIQSQKTNEYLDQDENQEFAHFLTCWDNEYEFKNKDQNILYQRPGLEHESVLDFANNKKQKSTCKKTEYKTNEKSFDNIETKKNKTKMVSDNNDSIALNKSQVSMHDNYQNCMNDSITNA